MGATTLSRAVRFGARAAALSLYGGVLFACSGAGNEDLLVPPHGVGGSVSTPMDASPSGQGEPEASTGEPDADTTADATSNEGDDDGPESQELEAAAPEAAPPGAEPVSPCPTTCTLGTMCCTLATSQGYGTCYNPNFCFGANCCD